MIFCEQEGMTTIKIIVLLFGLLSFAGMLHAGCAQDAYNEACTYCSFDANGKIDQSCSGGHQAAGTSCVSSLYPIMAGKYATGQCPQVDACASELRSCTAQHSSGNDKADCQEGSLSVCYSAADACMKQAAIKCGEVEKQCPGPSAFILLVLGASLFYYNKKG